MNSKEIMFKNMFGETKHSIATTIKSNQTTYFKGKKRIDNLFNLTDLEDILEQPGIFENIRFNKDGRDINAYDTLDRQNNGHIHIPSFLLHLHKGETCIVHKTEHRSNKIRQLCVELTAITKTPISCNIYLTPANQKAFPPHTDPHDVLVVQIAGKKEWNIEDRPKILHRRTMKSGDVLYIPKNTLHNAVSCESSEAYSMHLTFVIRKVYSEDLMAKYMTMSLDKDIENETDLSVQNLFNNKTSGYIENKIKRRGQNFDKECYEKAANKLIDRLIDESVYVFNGSINSVLNFANNSNSINRDTMLKKSKNWYRTSGTENRVLIHLKHYELNIPFGITYVERLLGNDEKYQIKSLGNTDEEAYLIIISEILVKRGILVICDDQNN